MSQKHIMDCLGPVGMDLSSNRGKEWNEFSDMVHEHIERYTVPQYGDMPNDLASSFTLADFIQQISRYAVRQGRRGGMRGKKEMARDFLKIAHYAGMAYMLIQRQS